MNTKPSTHTPALLPVVDSEQASALMARLESVLPASPWKTILQAFMVTGVLDSEHLRASSGLDRMALPRLLDRIESQRLGLPAIIHKVDRDIRRPGARGRTPRVYLLGESGAALLRLMGEEDARACGLHDDTAITHALAMVDVHQAAQQMKIDILTDRVVAYAEDRVLRPDHQVIHSDGKRILFEVEQAADTATVRRLVTSIEHKLAFFNAPESAEYERVIHMLVQLPRGTTWERTLRAWRVALQLCAEKASQQPPFRLLVLPLQEFLRQPDWSGTQRQDWLDLTAAETSEENTAQAKGGKVTLARPPKALSYGSSQRDAIVLRALWQGFLDSASLQSTQEPRATPDFLHLLTLIYAASHDTGRDLFDLASTPRASIYLLKRYLNMHPQLREQVQRALHNGRGTMRWNPTTILHRIQVVINTFMGYHGWRTDGPLSIWPGVSDWEEEGMRTFRINVVINDSELLMLPEDNVVPSCGEVIVAEHAITWVLWAIFNYAQELNFGRVEYW